MAVFLTLTAVMALTAALVWLPGRATLTPTFLPIHRLLLTAVPGYAILQVLAALFSVAPARSLWGPADAPYGSIFALATVVFFCVLVGTLETKAQVDRLISVILIGSVPAALYGLVQYLGLDPLRWVSDSVSPMHSTLGRSNFLAAYLALVIPFTLARLATVQGRPARWRYGILLALQMACLVLTQARAGWLGCVGAWLTFRFLLARGRRQQIPWVTLALSLIAGVVVYLWMAGALNAGREEAQAFAELRATSADRRWIIWQSTLSLISDRWLLGYGPGTFDFVFAARFPPGTLYDGADLIVSDPHNLILNQLMATGVVGLVAFLAIVACFYRTLLSAFALHLDRFTSAALAAVLGSTTAFLIQAQANPASIVPMVWFWLNLAVGVVLYRSLRSDPPCPI
jgi:putative inorganic carbon (HCO3(-)) transporter